MAYAALGGEPIYPMTMQRVSDAAGVYLYTLALPSGPDVLFKPGAEWRSQQLRPAAARGRL